jgi:hypothetical protein
LEVEGETQRIPFSPVPLWTIPTVMLLAFPPVPDKMIDR